VSSQFARLAAATVLLSVLSVPLGLSAQEVDKPREVVPLKDRIKAVQQKVFLKKGRFSFGPMVGFGLNDNYVHNFQLGGVLTYHITEQWGIEAAGGYTLHKTKSWINDVQDVYHFEIFPDIKFKEYAFNVSAVWSPIYGKWSVVDDFILHLDVYLMAGFMGLGVDGSFKPGGQVGVGFRVFTTRFMSVRLEYRDNMYGDDGFANHMLFNIGLDFYVPFDFEYTTGVKTIKRRTTDDVQPEERREEEKQEEEEGKQEEEKQEEAPPEPSLDDLELELGD